MANRIKSTSPGMKSQTPKRIKSTSQATLHTNPGGDNRWRPEVRFFAKTAKRIKSTSPGKNKKPKNESSLQARAPPPKPKRAPGSIRERSERVRYSSATVALKRPRSLLRSLVQPPGLQYRSVLYGEPIFCMGNRSPFCQTHVEVFSRL